MVPQIPNHPMRDFLIETMKREEPKMIQTYKLGMKFKQEVIAENKGVTLTDQQISQQVMMRMQQHMMKNAPKGMFRHPMPGQGNNPEKEPTKEERKAVMMQILTHLAKDIANFPEKEDVDRLIS